MRFTDRTIASLKPRPTRYEVWEGNGFGVRVGTTGKRTWVGVYHFAGKPRRLSYGAYPQMTLAAARVAHAAAKEKIQRGIDPGTEIAREREAEQLAETIDDLVAEYLERHAPKKRSGPQDRRTLERDILPVWRGRKAKDVTARDVVLLLDRIEGRGSPVMRNRTASLLSKLFRFGVMRGLVDASPAVGIERLPEAPRGRTLTPDEIRSLWHELDHAHIDRRTALAIRFCLVTGQRRSEVAGAKRDEIDDEETLWRVPGTRTKNGRGNLVPLPPFAMTIVREAAALRVRAQRTRPNRKDRPAYNAAPSPWLFRSTQGEGPIQPAALTRALNKNRKILTIGDATVHDLRRTFATVHGELGTSPDILAALLNHTPQGITERVYNLSTNMEPRRRAMERWCEWLEKVIAADRRR